MKTESPTLLQLCERATQGNWAVSSSTLVIAPDDPRDLAIICNTMDLAGVSGIGINEARANAEYLARCSPQTMKQVREALAEIEEGKGGFNRDQLQHAINVIERSKELARRALALLDGKDQP